MFLNIAFGILSGNVVLLLAKCFKHMSYVSWSKYLCNGVCGFPLLSLSRFSFSGLASTT